MQAIKESYIYHIWSLLRAFFARQWDQSHTVQWLTGQKPRSQGLTDRTAATLRRGLSWVCGKLRLDRVLQGSIFLHPLLFTGAAVVLSPLLPTMAIFGLVCASFFALVLKLGVDRDFQLRKSPLGGYVTLFAAVYLYATLTSVSLAGSLFPGLLTIAFVLFFFAVASSIQDRRKLELVLWAMLGVGVLVALYGFYQAVFPERFRSVWTDTDMFSSITFRVYSTLENPNVLGEYFLLIIPIGGAMVLTGDSWPKRIAALTACGIMGVCLIMTYSRGCYLGLLFAAAVFLVLLDRRFLVLGLIALVLSPLYLPESVLSRFTSIGDMGDTSTSYRVYIWMGTLAMLKHYWFCGVGPGMDAFNKVYPEYAYNAITAPHAHNLFLQITCDTGVCGIAVFLILLVAFYRMMFTAIRREGDRTMKIFQIAGTSAVTGFLVQSMTDYTFYNYRVLLLFWAMLGLCVVFTRLGREKEAAA